MPVRIYLRGQIWHYRGRAAGRRLRGTTGTADRKLAERIAAEAETRAWRRQFDEPEAEVSFAQAAIAYRAAEKPTRFLAKVEDHWRDTPLKAITAGAIIRSARELYPFASGATRNRQVIVPTQAIINHAAELGWCAPVKVKRFHVEPKTKRPVTLPWVEAFAAHASPHLGALAFFMFGTGARIGESVALTWSDVDLQAARATIRVTKPRRWERVAHLPSAVVAALANIPSNRAPEARVFGYLGRGSVKQPWDAAVARAGIERLTPHSCRHGFATAMLRLGIDVKTVAARGGWKDAGTVLRTYAHAIEDKSVTDALFDTKRTQSAKPNRPSTRKERGNRA